MTRYFTITMGMKVGLLLSAESFVCNKFSQNLPCIVAGHVLAPQPGDMVWVVDIYFFAENL